MFVEFHKINKQQSTKGVRILTMAGFLFFFGLRGWVQTDCFNYYSDFDNFNTIWHGGLQQIVANAKTETVFWIYAILIKSIYPNYFFFVFISVLIDVAILNVVFKRYSKYYVLSFILFFIFFGTIIELNLLRNVKSILLFLLSLRYLEERRMLPYMLLNGLGMLFHVSSIVYLPLYFVLHRNFSKTVHWIIFIIGNILFLSKIQYIQPIFYFLGDIIGGRTETLVHAYFTNDVFDSPLVVGKAYMERVVTFVVIMLFYTKLKQDRNTCIFVNICLVYVICFLYFSEMKVILDRLSYLFIASYWIIYANLLNIIQINANRKLYITLIIIAALIKTGTPRDILFKYDNLVFGIQKFEERKKILDESIDKVKK
jgi:hypothetical protein